MKPNHVLSAETKWETEAVWAVLVLPEADLQIAALPLTGVPRGQFLPSRSLSSLLAKVESHLFIASFIETLWFGHPLGGSGWGCNDEQTQTQSLTNNNFYFIGLLCGLHAIIRIKDLVKHLLSVLTLNYMWSKCPIRATCFGTWSYLLKISSFCRENLQALAVHCLLWPTEVSPPPHLPWVMLWICTHG